jgi:hypothetical protein
VLLVAVVVREIVTAVSSTSGDRPTCIGAETPNANGNGIA